MSVKKNNEDIIVIQEKSSYKIREVLPFNLHQKLCKTKTGMSKNYQEIKNNLNKLLKASHVNIKTLSQLFKQSSKDQKKIKILWRRLARAKRLKNRINSLVYAFYLREILETVTKSEKTICNGLLTRYFISVSIRTYYLFKKLDVEQIYRTSTMNLTMISKLESREFQNLVKLSDSIKDKLVNVNLPQETIMKKNDHDLVRPNSVQFEGISQHKFLIDQEDLKKL
ncbi:1546_t:CDS:1, partial [Cetraspora pellucida]